MRGKINWDALGIATSLACAIHCAILPLFITSLPLFGFNIIENSGFEYAMAAIAFFIGLYSLYHGKKKHHQSWLPVIVFSAGIVLLFAKIRWHQWSTPLLFPAVSAIITAHYLNFRLCRGGHGHSGQCSH